jgi:signal transduction histidine kinase
LSRLAAATDGWSEPGGTGASMAVLAHQLGETAAILDGYRHVLADAQGLDADAQHAARMIGLATDRVRRCADDLMHLTTAVRPPDEAVRSQPAKALARAYEAMRSDGDRCELVVEVEPPPAVSVEERELERLFLHLLRAVVAAAWDAERAPGVRLQGARVGSLVQLVLSDDAPVPPGPDRLFEPGAAPRGRGPWVGAGVGAAVCRRIVESHGGRIDSGLAVGGRLEVTFTLPASAR